MFFFGIQIFDILQSTKSELRIPLLVVVSAFLIGVFGLLAWLFYHNKTKLSGQTLKVMVLFFSASFLEVLAAATVAALLIKNFEDKWFVLLVLFTALGLFLIADVLRSDSMKS